jgi:hypothetical protein
MNNTIEFPIDELRRVKAVSGFLCHVFNEMSCREFTGDMTDEDANGVYVILNWMEKAIEASTDKMESRLAEAEINALTRVGLPEEAYTDAKLRKAWRDGFSRASKNIQES